jgi:restriction endonuclease Mrr
MDSLPTFEQVLNQVFVTMTRGEGGMSTRALYDAVSVDMGLSDSVLGLRMATGKSRFQNRAGWACSWLKACGWANNPRRAWWEVTPEGRERSKLGTLLTQSEMARIRGASHGLRESHPSRIPTPMNAGRVWRTADASARLHTWVGSSERSLKTRWRTPNKTASRSQPS